MRVAEQALSRDIGDVQRASDPCDDTPPPPPPADPEQIAAEAARVAEMEFDWDAWVDERIAAIEAECGGSYKISGSIASQPTYQGKVFNAPFKVVGSGAYSVSLNGDKSTGTLDFDVVLTVKIPTVGDQTNSAPASLTLTEAPPCAD